MRRRVVVTTVVHHPVEQVFAYLADPSSWHRFAPAVVSRRLVDDDVPGLGSRWAAVDRIGPFRIEFVDEMAELDPNRRVVWLSSAPWNARVEYACRPDEWGTLVNADYRGDISGSLRLLLGWVPAWATRRVLAGDFRRLDRLIASETAPVATPDLPLIDA